MVKTVLLISCKLGLIIIRVSATLGSFSASRRLASLGAWSSWWSFLRCTRPLHGSIDVVTLVSLSKTHQQPGISVNSSCSSTNPSYSQAKSQLY